MSVAHSFGISTPASIAARITDVPSGTVTATPSIESVTWFCETRAGVPPSSSFTEYIKSSSCRSSGLGRLVCRFDAEIFGEVFECAEYRERRHAAHRAQRAVHHGFAQIAQQRDVALSLFAAHDPLDHLHPPRGADAARSALSAGLDRAKLHGVTRHVRHVHRIVERHYAAVPDHAAELGKGLVIQRRVELRLRQKCSEGPAYLHSAERTSRRRSSAIVVQHFAQREAESLFHQPAVL